MASTPRPPILISSSRGGTPGPDSVGVSCGPATLVVLGIDAHAVQVPDRVRLLPGIPIAPQVNLDGLATGFDTLALLAALRGQPSFADDTETLRVRTPSGGLHIWYRNPAPPDPLPLFDRVQHVDGAGLAGGCPRRQRLHRGPMTRTTAGTYRPEGAARYPAPLPEWLAIDLIRTRHVPSQIPGPLPHPQRYAADGR